MPIRKSYFANTVESALSLAKQELGDEALLLESRRTRAEERHLGFHEIVVESQRQAVHPPTPVSLPRVTLQDSKSDWAHLSQDVSALRLELERLSGMLARISVPAAASGMRPDLLGLANSLSAADVPPILLAELLQRIGRRLESTQTSTPISPSTARNLVTQELGSILSTDSSLGWAGASGRLVALIGPCGAGKTTTLVKLAMRRGVEERRSSSIVSADGFRVGASEQLASYASILGLPFESAETLGSIARAIDENRQRSLVMIDTPGFGSADWDQAADLAGFLRSQKDCERHLVLHAAMSATALKRCWERWKDFDPSHLIFTHLDEAGALGPPVALAAESGLPISFLTDGQSIPEDITEASAPHLAELLLGLQAERSAVAA